MEKRAKHLYEKMIDYKRFATIMLAAGVFFYLGTIIPSTTKSNFDLNIMSFASLFFLAVSIILFFRSKKYRKDLLELDDTQEYSMKK
ncbi:MAG TPA: YrhC family protein [Bacillales bacterium]|nr:YrhC family protein [Bacillales bacterium]